MVVSCPGVDEFCEESRWSEPCEIVAQAAFKFSDDLPYGRSLASEDMSITALWTRMLWSLVSAIAPEIRQKITRIAVNGTSSTMLLSSRSLSAVSNVLMYDDARGRAALDEVSAMAPPNSPTISATSTLTKAIWLYRERLYREGKAAIELGRCDIFIDHQADWLSRFFHYQLGITDYHNALKLGYDVKTLSYPQWLLNSPIASWLPDVVAPGEVIGRIHPTVARIASFPRDCMVCAGTTDSIAAFLASGAKQTGEAVTSLGSTLVLKLLSSAPIENQTFGIYSHRLGNLWLTGGASNTGGAVLKQFFSSEQLADLSSQIDISKPCGLDYYPLNDLGERFPVNDPDYPPRLTPRPDHDRDFLYGLLDGVARIEADGYQKLKALGAPALQKVYTAGGGAQNEAWQAIRQQKLGVEVVAAERTEAAYGTALLAMHGLSNFR